MDTSITDTTVSVFPPPYQSSEPVQLVITGKKPGLFRRELKITDADDNLVFRTKNLAFINFRLRTALVDPSGNHIMQFRKKWPGRRWEVFRGESFDQDDLIFTVERSKLLGQKKSWQMFSATSTQNQIREYRIEGNYLRRTCKVYKTDSSNVLVAQMVKVGKLFNKIIQRGSYVVSIDPNVDIASIITLFAIRHEVYRNRRKNIFCLGLSPILM